VWAGRINTREEIAAGGDHHDVTAFAISVQYAPLCMNHPETLRRRPRRTTMSGDRLEVNVTFDERGYIGSAPELRSPVVALSLGGLRRRIEALMLPDDVIVTMNLDRAARQERDRRRLGRSETDARAPYTPGRKTSQLGSDEARAPSSRARR
jgi:hypothetical protein